MIRAYSQRLLPPFSGVVLIAESERVRAQSFDGTSWEFQYLPGNARSDGQQRVQGYGLDRGYYNVASLHRHELKMFMFPSFLDHDQVAQGIHELKDFLASSQLPFPAADIYEYWLLDSADDTPLALIHSCCDESLMDKYPGRMEWTALPHSKMGIENTESEDVRKEPPVNHRFQRLIAGRAGANPRAAWFKRNQDDSHDFPSLLVREDWQDEVDHDLCQRYLMRKAARLLMLHGLSYDDRERLEVAARQHVFEVEQYHSLYPEVNDERRMKAMRVEAQLRRTAPQVSPAKKKGHAPSDPTLGKDMRIFET
jgi:hypothetical protein